MTMATLGSQREAAISIAFGMNRTPTRVFMPLVFVTLALSRNTMVPSIGLIPQFINHG